MPVHSPLLQVRIMGCCNKRPAGYNGHTNVLTNWDHICSNICMTMRLHACQYRTCMHIQSDFDQYNITHSTAWIMRQFCEHACIYSLGVQRVNLQLSSITVWNNTLLRLSDGIINFLGVHLKFWHIMHRILLGRILAFISIAIPHILQGKKKSRFKMFATTKK